MATHMQASSQSHALLQGLPQQRFQPVSGMAAAARYAAHARMHLGAWLKSLLHPGMQACGPQA